MTKVKVAIVIALLCCMTCCAVSDPNELRKNHAGKISFMVNSGYQEVYRRIVEHKRIHPSERISQIYTDQRAAKIILRRPVAPSDSYVLIDIVFVENNLTSVDFYYYYSVSRDLGIELKEMLTK